MYASLSDAPVMSVAVFLGVVGPGSKHLWVEGINLHKELSKTQSGDQHLTTGCVFVGKETDNQGVCYFL